MRPDQSRPPGPGVPNPALDSALALARRLLARRAAVRWGAVGAWAGSAAAALWLGGWLLRWLPLPAFGWLLAPICVLALGSAATAWLSFRARREDLALLVDRVLGTDEVAVTAVGLVDGCAACASPMAPFVLDDVERALDGSDQGLRDRLRLRWPRHLRLLPLALLAIAAMTMLPRAPLRDQAAGPAGDIAAEADRLEQRKEEIERELGIELPEEMQQDLADLVEAMRNGSIDAGEAARRADELGQRLAEHVRQSGDGAAQALREAAENLERADPDLGQDLRDALRDGDLAEAREAVDRMRERMEQRPQAERDRAARELERAAQAAAQGPLPGLGGALRAEAERLRQQGGQGGQQGGQRGQDSPQGGQSAQGSQGAQGSQQPGQGGQQGGQGSDGEGGLSEYLEQLEREGLGGDGLAEQEARARAGQAMEQALGGAAGRLGEREGGAGRGEGEGTEAGWGAGRSHTDEEEGNYETAGHGHQDMDRQVDGRHSDWVVPFDQQHDPKRLDGVDAVASTVAVPLGDGPVETESMRLSGSGERSAAPLLEAPAGYREAAEEAIEGEAIPRAYRDQVKRYFDGVR